MAVIFGLMAELQPNDEGELVPNLPGASGPIALIAANLFVVSFGMSWGPMVWVLLGEMFPNRIRAAALGLAAAGQWVANWLITVTFPGLRDHLGAAYGFYAICAFLSFLFVWKWVEETKGKHLEDMHREAHDDQPGRGRLAITRVTGAWPRGTIACREDLRRAVRRTQRQSAHPAGR